MLVRYFAGARAAAGIAEESVTASTLGELVECLGVRHGERLARVLTACSYLADGVSIREPSCPLNEVSTVDVLPPFAGG